MVEPNGSSVKLSDHDCLPKYSTAPSKVLIFRSMHGSADLSVINSRTLSSQLIHGWVISLTKMSFANSIRPINGVLAAMAMCSGQSSFCPIGAIDILRTRRRRLYDYVSIQVHALSRQVITSSMRCSMRRLIEAIRSSDSVQYQADESRFLSRLWSGSHSGLLV